MGALNIKQMEELYSCIVGVNKRQVQATFVSCIEL